MDLKIDLKHIIKSALDARQPLDELQLMRSLRQRLKPQELNERKVSYATWMLEGEQNAADSKSQLSIESKRLREEGNKLMTTNTEQKTIAVLLEACRLYTEAILTAPLAESNNTACMNGVCDKEAVLALAYANRACALQECGYYAEAYDDCLCALQYGYPEKMHRKIITRQAYCALRLKNVEALQRHLNELEAMKLNEHFERQKQELQGALLELERESEGVESEGILKLHDSSIRDREEMGLTRARSRRTQQIKIDANPSRGRYMTATEEIKENDLVFCEPVLSFLPVADTVLCQYCGNQMFIPYPCQGCHAQVMYCSLQCKLKHQVLHSYECPGYQYSVWQRVGIGHLALRMLLNGLPQILPLLEHLQSADDLWSALNQYKGSCEVFQDDNKYPYLESLSLVSNLGNMAEETLAEFALTGDKLSWYLRECTGFFKLFAETKVSEEDWTIVVASILMRHIGQAVINAHAFQSLTYVHPMEGEVGGGAKSPSDVKRVFPLLESRLWSAVSHLKCGLLHRFSGYTTIVSANLPYLSICNHACAVSLQQQFSRGRLKAFATKDIHPDDEIFNCYVLDYRSSTLAERQGSLQSTYGFTCECSKCQREHPNRDLEQFHRYRCQNNGCQHAFTPPTHSLHWWLNCGEFQYIDNIELKCPKCQQIQNLSWYVEFWKLLYELPALEPRQLLYSAYDSLNRHLLECHQLKFDFGLEIIENLFKLIEDGFPLHAEDFEKLATIIKFILHYIEVISRRNSIEFIAKMTYLWDLIALKRVQFNQNEFQPMLNAIDFLSIEYRILFRNYYDDYIKGVLK